MAQNMKLSIVGQGIENVIVEVNPHETFEEFQQKVFKESNLCITVEDFQLFFENLQAGDNLFDCLRENLNIGDDMLSLENAPIYEINILRGGNVKDEHNSSFIINDVIESAAAEHFDSYKEVQNLNSSLMVLNEGQASEYTILNENLFEPSDFIQNKKQDDSDQQMTLFSENDDIVATNFGGLIANKEQNLNKENHEKDNEPSQNYNYMDIESQMAEMHDYNEEIITDICRLCARNITEGNKIEIYDEKEKLDEKINTVLPIIIIKKEDGLPQQICRLCTEKITNYYDFVQTVVEGDKQLRIKFPNTLNNTSSSVPDLVNELFSPSSQIIESQVKNIKFEPLEPNESENEFETEYLLQEPENRLNRDKLNCRLCDLILDNMEEAVNHSLTEHQMNNLFVCVFCDLGFQSPNSLQQHIKIEHRNLFAQKYQCTVCSKKYSSQLLLLKHTCVKSTANKTLHCEVCNNAFPSKVRLNFHRQFHVKDARPLFCAECNMSFKNENEFFDHVNFIHDAKQSFPCDICDKTFSIRAALNNHKKVHTGVRNHKCEICDKTFLDKQTLRDHEVVHMDTKPFQCHICGKNLNRLSRLRRHLLTHESNPVINDVHICEICKEAFADEGNAEFHKTCQHGNRKDCIKMISTDKVFRCEFCEKCYYTPMALNDHRSIHTGPTPYSCHICKAQFSSYPRCTTHKTTHGLYKDGAEKDHFPVVKHFLCEHCGKSYLHWTYLGLHRRLKHSETVQVHKCSDCKLQFPNSWGLAYHRKTKHSIDNFKCIECGKVLANEHCLKLHHLTKHIPQKKDNQCVICGKIFQYPTSLEAHMKAHKGLREFKCALCPKVYLNLGTLTAHFAEHKARKFVFPETESLLNNTDRPFTCEVCGLSFRRQFTLKNHKLKHTQPTAEGSFVLMVDMKEDDDKEQDKTPTEQQISQVLENKTQEMTYMQVDQNLTPNYIDMGNGNILQIQGNTFSIEGKQYVLIGEDGKAIGRNQEFEMIVDETLRGEEQNQANFVAEQQQLENNVMYVESDNNYVIQNEMQPEYIFTTTDKTAKTVTTAATTYVIDGNEFLLQPDEQTF